MLGEAHRPSPRARVIASSASECRSLSCGERWGEMGRDGERWGEMAACNGTCSDGARRRERRRARAAQSCVPCSSMYADACLFTAVCSQRSS